MLLVREHSWIENLYAITEPLHHNCYAVHTVSDFYLSFFFREENCRLQWTFQLRHIQINLFVHSFPRLEPVGLVIVVLGKELYRYEMWCQRTFSIRCWGFLCFIISEIIQDQALAKFCWFLISIPILVLISPWLMNMTLISCWSMMIQKLTSISGKQYLQVLKFVVFYLYILIQK
jgi:hypothetical protein